jgi:hypothetical protein
MAGKVKTALSDEEYENLLAELRANSGNPSHKLIAQTCAKYGVPVSVSGNGATASVKKDFNERIEDIRRAAQANKMLAQAGEAGVPAAKAGMALGSQKIFERLLDREQDDEILQGAMHTLARIQKAQEEEEMLGLRRKQISAQIEKIHFDAAAAVLEHLQELKAVAGDRTLDDPKRLERVRTILFGEAPPDFQPVTAKGAQ